MIQITVRFYSSVATEKTLSGTITAGATSMTVSNTIGLPSSFPYTLAVDYETVSEELVEVTSAAGSLLTITRAIDGTSATSHTAGARVRHVTSARDFSDSRNHENASNGVHGLSVGEDLVGTTKVQTLSNKTVVDLQGTLLNPDITINGTTTTSITRTPAGSGTVNAVELVNGTAQTFALTNDGNTKIRNTVAMDSTTTDRRLTVLMSNGTTELAHVDSGGMGTFLPRSGTADTNGGVKIIEPSDSLTRKAFQIRNSADAVDRFVVTAGGSAQITEADPGQIPLYVKGAAAQTASHMAVADSAASDLFLVDLNGNTKMNRRAEVYNNTTPASTVLLVQGNATQTGDLQRWNNSAGTTLARVFSDGTANFANSTATTSIIVAAAGWSITSQTAVTKAGMATLNLILQRTGSAITATSTGDVAADPAVCTVQAAYLPAGFGAQTLIYTCGNENGDGTVIVDPATGNVNLTSWSSNGSVATGTQFKMTMTWPLA